MNFISLSFIIFISIVILVYFVLPKRVQWIVLLVASYIFYFSSSITMSVFLVFSTLTTFYSGILISKVNNKQSATMAAGKDQLTRDQKKQLKSLFTNRKRTILFCALVVNFGILAFLKYFNFVSANINAIFSSLSVNTHIPYMELLLPLGISFYIFQSAGYVIDVYRGKFAPDRNLAKYALFVSFFPQIVQGPIGRYNDLAQQLFSHHSFDFTQAKRGAQLILWGFFKKLVVADRAALLVNQVFGNYEQYAGIEIFIGAVVYCVQVYADFSGGIDIATGVAQIMGIKLAKNFERPYFARSISEFWQRWHITLGSWMRDYLFYPLCLSRPFTRLGMFVRKKGSVFLGKILPTLVATFIIFIVIGIWHGASWKFIAYGFYNGLLISLALLLSPLFDRIKKHIRTESFSWRLFQTGRTFLLVSIGRYFSRATSLSSATRMLEATFSAFNPWVLFDGSLYNLGLDQRGFAILLAGIVVWFVVSLMQERGICVREWLERQNIVFRWSIYLTFISVLMLFSCAQDIVGEFIYAQF